MHSSTIWLHTFLLCFITFFATNGFSQFKQFTPAMYSNHDGHQKLQAGQLVTGKVIGVKDGDTIQVLSKTNNEPKVYDIRLAEIDAPEKHQAFGNKSKQALSDKIFGKEVSITVVSTDRYGRTVAQIFIDNRWINLEMVAEGWAWQYMQYSKSKELALAEQPAREKKLGLWADKDPIPPWEYRKPTQVKTDDEPQIQPLFKVEW